MPAGLPLHKAGSFNDAHNIYDLFDGDRPTSIRRSNMDSYKDVLYAAGLPALISTGITLIYFLLKAYQFAVYALSNKTEGRLAAAMPGGCQQEHCSIEGKEGHTEVHEQVSGGITDQYGAGIQQPSGSFSVPRRQKDVCISARQNVAEYPEEPYDKMKKDCQAEGVELPQTIMAKGPVAHMMTPQEYLQKVAAGQMLPMDNHQMMVELAEKHDQTKILMMEFRDIESPKHK